MGAGKKKYEEGSSSDIFVKNGKWFFWDGVVHRTFGPFESKRIARQKYTEYLKKKLRALDASTNTRLIE